MDHFGGDVGGAFGTKRYQCFSCAVSGRDLQEGDKLILPPSALRILSRMKIEYPMVFEMKNEAIGKTTHAGCLEFSALEGECYMPYWKMESMAIEEGQLVEVKYVTLSKATYVKFCAQSCDFLLISDHKAVLESSLRSFTCLTSGDMISIFHDNTKYELEVLEVQPNGAACIVETDCNVDFTEPVGYKQWKALQDWEAAKAHDEQQVAAAAAAAGCSGPMSGNRNVEGEGSGRVLQKAREGMMEAKTPAFQPFGGTAHRLGGKSVGNESKTTSHSLPFAVDCGGGGVDKDSGHGGGDRRKSGVSDMDKKSENQEQKEGVELICSDGANIPSPVNDNGSTPARKLQEPTVVSVPAPPPYPSRLGNKFATKKSRLWSGTDKSQPQFIGEGRVLGGEMKPRNWRTEQEGPFKEEKQGDK